MKMKWKVKGTGRDKMKRKTLAKQMLFVWIKPRGNSRQCDFCFQYKEKSEPIAQFLEIEQCIYRRVTASSSDCLLYRTYISALTQT